MAVYDKYYKTENLFGKPYSELITFFKNYEPKGKLIDIGCGQGRDCIPLARLGYQVTGIDNSKVGINQMVEKSGIEKLNITGLIDDIFTFADYEDYDILLLNSMFHFEKRDLEKETDFIEKISKEINPNGVICFCIQDTGKKIKILKDTIANSNIEFDVLNDTSLIYKYEDKKSDHKSETKYCMFIIKKK